MTVSYEAYPNPPPLKKVDQPKLKINILGNSMRIKNKQAPEPFVNCTLMKKGEQNDHSVYISQTTKETVLKCQSRKDTCDTD